MIIIMDKNEAQTNPPVYQDIKRHFEKVLLANLPHREHGGRTVTAGDINIPLDDGSFLAIERKTPEDFVQSIFSGHIFHQVEVMAKHAKYSAVIITGAFEYSRQRDIVKIGDKTFPNWHGKTVRSTITLIQYSGCPVIFCPPARYCDMIAELYSLLNGKDDMRQSARKNRIITFPPVDDRVEFLAQLPGVGLNSAKSILNFAGMMAGVKPDVVGDTYGTLADAIHWISILVQIDKDQRPAGWTASKILNVRKFLGLASDEYISPVKEETVTVGAGKNKVQVSYAVMNNQRYIKENK